MDKALARPSEMPPGEIDALSRLREDMELLAYIASHDLLAPLRIMDHCRSILAEKQDGNSDAEEQDALETLNSEIIRARALLQGVLDYIRLETFVPNHVALDANEIVASALDSLGDEIKAAGATVTYDALPMVLGHRGRLARLFGSLVENAIKFRGEQPVKVHISARKEGASWTFCVEDNGIGIDPELQEVIFRLFQRLHTQEDYPGYGIGLALSQKIATAHGGKLWVESEPGKGSRFFVTLPAAKEIKNN